MKKIINASIKNFSVGFYTLMHNFIIQPDDKFYHQDEKENSSQNHINTIYILYVLDKIMVV
jgi:hypothetical protein